MSCPQCADNVDSHEPLSAEIRLEPSRRLQGFVPVCIDSDNRCAQHMGVATVTVS